MRHPSCVARPVVLAALAACALAAVPAAPRAAPAGDATERQSYTFAVRDGQTWSVAADVASVRVVGDPAQRAVRVDVTRHGPAPADLVRLPALVREGPLGPEMILRQSDGALDPALRAEVTITTPAQGSGGSVTLVEGAIDVRGFHGHLDAVTARGSIVAADVSGVLRLESTIGNIDVSGAALDAGGLLRLRTFNGDVRLALAAWPRDARVMALALNGTITSAIPLTLKDGWGPKWGEATLGSGAHVVSLDVVTGAIRIEAPAAR